VQKKSQEGINTRLALVMKSGKFTLGTKTCLKCLRSGKGEQCLGISGFESRSIPAMDSFRNCGARIVYSVYWHCNHVQCSF
jgi:hypothetical protein